MAGTDYVCKCLEAKAYELDKYRFANTVTPSLSFNQSDKPKTKLTHYRNTPRVDRLSVKRYWFCMATATQVQKNLQAAMRDALRIQDRFVAEPLFAKTGRGYLKSEGVSTLQKIKSSLRRKSAAKGK